MTSADGILDGDRLAALLPPRYPLLLIDRVERAADGLRAVGLKNVSFNEPYFQGHFPGRPVMPGVLVLEAMIQTGALLLPQTPAAAGLGFAFLKSVARVKFRKPVVPGDRLMVEVERGRSRRRVVRFRAVARVGEHVACQAEFTLGRSARAEDVLAPSVFAPPLHADVRAAAAAPLHDTRGILNTIPHRYPFLLVDAILRQTDTHIYGLKNVTRNEAFAVAHFPERSVMPGVLLVEAMAQVGAVFILGRPHNRGKLGFFMAVDRARFLRPVRPGDQVVMALELTSDRPRVGRARGRAFVGDALVAETEIAFVIVEPTAAG